MTSLSASRPSLAADMVPGALVRLCSRAQRELWGLRLARVYGFGIGASYALIELLGPPGAGASARLWVHALEAASWLAGVGALSLATDLPARDATQGLTGLARLRGFSDLQLERARTLAGALRLGSAVLVPGLILAATALLRLHTWRDAVQASALALLTLPYAALVGASLAPLARACSRWLPGRGRLLLMSLALGPFLLAKGLQSDVPSLPAAYAWLLHHAARSVH